MHYADIIKTEYIDQYIDMQKTLFSNLSRILFDIVFLRKAVENNGINLLYDSGLTIRDLFQNTFQYLIVKVSRSIFDTGSDTITISRFKNSVLKKFLKDEFRQIIFDSQKDSKWYSKDVKIVYSRIEDSLSGLRNHYIAHSLQGETDEISVSLPDIEILFYAAVELFEILSFETSDLYKPRIINENYFVDEEKAISKSCDRFFSYQYLSSHCIEKITCEYKKFCDEDERTIVQKHLNIINNK